MPFVRRREISPSIRRIIVAFLLCAGLANCLGVPAFRRPAKDHSVPFPCQDSPCGCATAEQCWRHCCCHTNREKLVWAHRHGVTPPDYVIASARRESGAVCKDSGCIRCKRCCGTGHKHAAEPASTAQQGRREALNRFGFAVINSDLARKCHGLPELLGVVDCLAIPDPPICWTEYRTVIGRTYDIPCLARSAEQAPPVPPPRLMRYAA